MSIYLSSLYGPVYLVSHIVTMYVMPQFGLIIALVRKRKSGCLIIIHPEYSSNNKSCSCYCAGFFLANDDDIQ